MSTISRSRPTPLYAQLKQLLLARIQDGTLEPGAYLPTERQLERDYGVSRITARRALDDLEAEGYVSRQAGRGTVVLHPKIRHNAGRLGGLEEDLASQGFQLRSKILFHGRHAASDSAAHFLGVPPGHEVLFERRLIFANEAPLVLGTSYHNFPPDVTFTQRDLEDSYIFKLAREQYGMSFFRVDRTMEAALPTTRTAELLHMDPTVPVLVAELKVYSEDDLPTSFVRARYRGDRYQYHQTMHL